MNVQEAKTFLNGPVPSIRPGFDAEGEIDYQTVRNIIDVAIEGGCFSVILTCGDSHYDILSDDEIAEMTRVTLEYVKGRVKVVVADRYHSTKRAIEFARYCRDIGADMYMALPPDWGHSTTPATLAEHYGAIAEILPVMIVTNRFITRGIPFGIETLERSFNLSKNILAIKDDMCGTFAHDICMRFNERAAIIAGGQKRNHMNMFPYGCDGYLSTFAAFNSKISRLYWAAIEQKDMPSATKIIKEKDAPFFRYLSGLQGNFDAGIHGMFELYGLGQRYRRKPYYTINDEELEQLGQFLTENQLL